MWLNQFGWQNCVESFVLWKKRVDKLSEKLYGNLGPKLGKKFCGTNLGDKLSVKPGGQIGWKN